MELFAQSSVLTDEKKNVVKSIRSISFAWNWKKLDEAKKF